MRTLEGDPVVSFGRELLKEYQQSVSKEWLVTNGIGGYACGTVAGALSRRYHGLLIAPLDPPLKRTLLLGKIDETAVYRGLDYPLFTNHWASGAIEPTGSRFLERFHLEQSIPVWTYSLADARLEKRVWMHPGENTVYLRYDHQRGADPIRLTLNVLIDNRDHHANTTAGPWPLEAAVVRDGLKITSHQDAVPLYVFAPGAELNVNPQWDLGFYLASEAYRGLDPEEDLLRAAILKVNIQPGDTFLLVASTLENPVCDAETALAARKEYELDLIARAGPWSAQDGLGAIFEQLVLAADQFVTARDAGTGQAGQTVMAGYPWFSDWGRDTMISLPGLTLSTGRPDIAKSILRTYAGFVDRGMLPNRFPDTGQAPEYNTVDATLWYFEAVRAYFGATADKDFIHELYPVLEEIVGWHRRGTRYHIRLDAADGLLYAGEPGVQLTWMDAKIGDWVVTPRIGKAVEVNALWYNALRVMQELSLTFGVSGSIYRELADQAQQGFARFWNHKAGYCYDVIDGPGGPETALRPNQLLAVSLAHSPLPASQARAVVDACASSLYTSHGLRSLASDEPGYLGVYGGDQGARDAAYHQGTVWGWLMGPFISAHIKVYKDPALARSYLRPLLQNLFDHGLGSLSEIFDGDAPHTPRGCIAQAWTVAEVLRVMGELRSLEN